MNANFLSSLPSMSKNIDQLKGSDRFFSEGQDTTVANLKKRV